MVVSKDKESETSSGRSLIVCLFELTRDYFGLLNDVGDVYYVRSGELLVP